VPEPLSSPVDLASRELQQFSQEGSFFPAVSQRQLDFLRRWFGPLRSMPGSLILLLCAKRQFAREIPLGIFFSNLFRR
jgi:hypothetical protein